MNREAAARLWPIIKAFGEGERLQWKPWKGWPWEDLFCDEGDMAVNFDSGVEFRVKPPPRKVTIAYIPGNPWVSVSPDTLRIFSHVPGDISKVKFLEVELPE